MSNRELVKNYLCTSARSTRPGKTWKIGVKWLKKESLGICFCKLFDMK